MTRSNKYSELPPAAELGPEREREFPCCVIANWLDVRSPKETDCWQFDLGLAYADCRKEFAIWCIRGFGLDAKERAICDLRKRAAKKGVIFIEIYHSSPPPTIAEVLDIEKINKRLTAEYAEKINHEFSQNDTNEIQKSSVNSC